MYTSSTIDNVRAADIVSVVSHFVKLNRHNGACCPFHNEKTASFSVSVQKQIYKCFGCGAGGDVIAFVMAHENCDFVRAIEIIADLEGLALELEAHFDQEAFQKQREEKKTMREVLKDAHSRYRAQLLLPENKAAMDYWENRGYDREDMAYWGLGYAPNNMNFLARVYAKAGNLPEALSLGICREKEGKTAYDMYIGRVIIPILDDNGEIIALAGRVLDTGSKYAKYINGTASPLYDKSKTLFGLYQATKGIKETGFAILTEGYTDVMSMHKAGAANTVAACGTAFTDDMARLLKKYTRHVVLMRDADDAGEKAENKDLEILLRHAFKVELLQMPAGQDPDNFAQQYFDTKKTTEGDHNQASVEAMPAYASLAG